MSAAPKMTHAQLQAGVDDIARRMGWRIMGVGKVFDGRSHRWRTPFEGDGKGWADRLYVRAPWMLFVDFKVPPDSLSVEQRQWFQVMGGFDFVLPMVWTPRDWSNGQIDGILRSPDRSDRDAA